MNWYERDGEHTASIADGRVLCVVSQLSNSDWKWRVFLGGGTAPVWCGSTLEFALAISHAEGAVKRLAIQLVTAL